ncbi:serine/threonine protein kinase [Rhizobium ruizarguesonis]|uniref:serine/threonine protein kinase n=1 Tax=Rhizobium ruizarguesonis TaxID=2081791 RepID=UPI0013C8AC30|nr:protein kinase [Rhizobium ruizarguesonis]NEH27454.1 protein kinase [Rhizobium ruizarguesonis]
MKEFNLENFPSELHDTLLTLAEQNEIHGYSEKGASGYVVFGRNKVLKRDVAIKFYYWENGDHAEPELLAKLDHKNILKIFHAAPVDSDYAYFTTKYCEGGDLDHLLDSEQTGVLKAIDVVMDIASGASFLHANGYVHRDLKPQNVFCDGDVFVIGDFGSVAPYGGNGACDTITQHSLIYRPPEVVTEKKHFKASDIYQLGIVLYQLLGGALSYEEVDWLSLQQKKKYEELVAPEDQLFATAIIEAKIKAGRVLDTDTLPAYVPLALRTFLRKATHREHTKRHESVADFLAALNNLRVRLLDWKRVEGGYLLTREKKFIKVENTEAGFFLHKNSGNGWKKYHGQKVVSLRHAVEIAETL